MRILICGAGGFIGGHLTLKLKNEGHEVIAVDIKKHEHRALDVLQGDLGLQSFCDSLFLKPYDEIYQLAADMGGAGYIFTGENDAQVMHNSLLCNINILERAAKGSKKIFFSSSARISSF